MNNVKCTHEAPRDFLERVDTFRVHLPEIQTENYYYKSAYYQVFVEVVRCQSCRRVFRIVRVMHWRSNKLKGVFYTPLAPRFGNMEDFRARLLLALKEKYAKKLKKYRVVW